MTDNKNSKLYFILKKTKLLKIKLSAIKKFKKMASANIYSLENAPEFEFIVNNKGGK